MSLPSNVWKAKGGEKQNNSKPVETDSKQDATKQSDKSQSTGYYEMGYPTSTTRGGVQYNMNDRRFARADNTFPVQTSSIRQEVATGGTARGHGNTNSGVYGKGPSNFTGSYAHKNNQGSRSGTTADFKTLTSSGPKVQPTQSANPSSNSDLVNIYSKSLSKSYEKQGFHFATPPPFNLGSQNSGMGPGGGYTQHLFIPAMTPHHNTTTLMHQPIHQTYEKQGFHCAMPPPFNLGSQNSGMGPGGGYTQHLFTPAMTPHHNTTTLMHQPIHQTYEKQGFHCAMPPPFNLGSQNSGMGPGGGYTQHLFIPAMTPHHNTTTLMHQPIHQSEWSLSSKMKKNRTSGDKAAKEKEQPTLLKNTTKRPVGNKGAPPRRGRGFRGGRGTSNFQSNEQSDQGRRGNVLIGPSRGRGNRGRIQTRGFGRGRATFRRPIDTWDPQRPISNTLNHDTNSELTPSIGVRSPPMGDNLIMMPPRAERPSITSQEIRMQRPRPKIPPPSKIPATAVEMPPDSVENDIGLLDVQFGAMELNDSSNESVQETELTPSIGVRSPPMGDNLIMMPPRAERPSIKSQEIRVQRPKPKIPPPSKIPATAVEMPPDSVENDIGLLDVQFGAMELNDSSNESVQETELTPSIGVRSPPMRDNLIMMPPRAERPSIKSQEIRVQRPKPKIPPPSKIPATAVEMPPDSVENDIGLLDVQFGAMELNDSSNESVQETELTPSIGVRSPPMGDNLIMMPPRAERPSITSQEIRMQRPRPKIPPPSKIPATAVEMPPDSVENDIGLLDVQFGAMELSDSSNESVQVSPPAPRHSPSPVQSDKLLPHQSKPWLNISTGSEETPTREWKLLTSTPLSPLSISIPFNGFESVDNDVAISSVLSTGAQQPKVEEQHEQEDHEEEVIPPSSRKEFETTQPIVNLSSISHAGSINPTPTLLLASQTTPTSKPTSISSMGKSMVVANMPPGVPPLVGTQNIMGQGGIPYFQQPMIYEDLQLMPQQRLAPHISASQVHQQPMMNPTAIPQAYAYFYGGSAASIPGNFQYGAPTLYPVASGGMASGHGNTNSGVYGKGPSNFTGSYPGRSENNPGGGYTQHLFIPAMTPHQNTLMHQPIHQRTEEPRLINLFNTVFGQLVLSSQIEHFWRNENNMNTQSGTDFGQVVRSSRYKYLRRHEKKKQISFRRRY